MRSSGSPVRSGVTPVSCTIKVVVNYDCNWQLAKKNESRRGARVGLCISSILLHTPADNTLGPDEGSLGGECGGIQGEGRGICV